MRTRITKLQSALHALQRDLSHHAAYLARVLPDFRPRYLPLLDRYSQPFRVRRLDHQGAFEVNNRRDQLTFNASSYESFHRPIFALEQAGGITHDHAEIARHIATEQLTLHELSHVTVGLVDFADVAPFKELVGTRALGETDVVADISAARICARLEMARAEERGWAGYASRLLQQLYVMGQFAFPAFRAPADKPHKRQRFLGLAMTAALTRDFLRRAVGPNVKAGEFPLGTPLFPYFDEDSGKMLIGAFNPDRQMWGRVATVDPELLKQTLSGLDNEPFHVSVDGAAKLLAQIGQLRASGLRDPEAEAAEALEFIGRQAGMVA